MIRLIAIIILCLGLAGCGGSAHDARLSRIADSIDANPHGALAALDSIDASQLSEYDRHYYDLLTVKSCDKAYVTHTSDSLILSVMQYYEHHDTDLYPEALYYGGRVYSDLGDFPTALRYFQDALSVTPDDNLDLLGRLYSQTGRLLNTLRQYRQAIPYIEKSLHLDSIQKDTFNLAYDHQLLGNIYIDLEDYYNAAQCMKAANEYASYLNSSDNANMAAYNAIIKYHNRDYDKALEFIRMAMKGASPDYKWFNLANACDIYYASHKFDTTYYFARQLCDAPVNNNRKTGYLYLFKPEVAKYLNTDSVPFFLDKYKTTIEEYLCNHDAESTLIQSTQFNYNIHERERLKAENSALRLKFIISAVIIITLLLTVLILFLKNAYRKSTIQLQNALMTISDLEEKLTDADTETKLKKLRIQLKNNLNKYEPIKKSTRPFIEPEIIESDVMCKINEYLENGKRIPDNSIFWHDIEKLVLQISPGFKKSILFLTNNKISVFDMHLLYLIRCGVRPGQLEILFGRTIGTISNHRVFLSERMMNEKLGNKYFDLIISSL